MKRYCYSFILILFLSFLLTSLNSFSKDKINIKDVKNNLSGMLGANNVGKEFWFAIPPCYEDEAAGYANFIKIFVTSPLKTLVTVEVPGKGYFKSRNTIPNDVIEFNITPVQGSPWTKNGQAPNPPDAVFPGAGIHVSADQPLVVYCVVRYHWSSDGFLCVPVSSLGREYIMAGNSVDAMFGAMGYKLPGIGTITAAYDNTKVRFTLGGNTVTKTAGGLTPGSTKEWNMMKGDVLAITTNSDEADLSGSKVSATKPVGVVTGQFCSNIPSGNQWCDYTAEMDIPTFTWGLDNHLGKIPNRKFSSLIKIFAKEPNTKIFRDGRPIGTLQTSGGIEGKAFFYMRMTPDMKPGSVVISGDKPITVDLYNCGVQEDGYPRPNSDPFVMATTPVQQYQYEITFMTPGISGAQNFPENYVNLVYETDENQMMPDHVEFAGPVHGGEFTWVRCNTKFPSVDELFKYDVNGKKYALKTITLPGDGVYKIRSKTPFAAYSFGFSDYDSYGFPTAAALADLEKPDTVAPNPTWTIGCDGNVTDGVVRDLPEDKTIRSNLSMIVYHTDFSFNYEFQYDDFIPGEAQTTKWTLKVIDPSQDARAVISFMDRRGNDTTIEINYYATKLTIRPTLADFGSFKNGESKTLDFWAINFSDQSVAIVKDLKLQKGTEGFVLTLPANITLPYNLNPLDSFKFQVTFTATAEGKFKDSIGLGDNCVFFYKTLVMASVGNPIIYVDDCPFDKISVGKTQTKEFSIYNEGTVDLVITGYTGPSTSVYTTTLPLIDINNPLIIAPKQLQTFQVTFAPQTVGKFPDRIDFTNDAGTNRKNYCLISGESMQPGLFSWGHDWKYKRINKVYDNEGDSVIKLINDGSEDVYVSQFTVINDVKGDAFEFDRAKINNGITIPANSSVYIPVNFHPVIQGYHELTIKFENSAGRDVQITLKGVGIEPRISTDDYNFGITMIQDPTTMTKRTVVFRNLKYQTDGYETSDIVTISNFTENTSDIGTDGVTFGPNSWTYNKPAITFPIQIQPGDSIEFESSFIAQVEGQIKSSITTVSDAETEATSNWLGEGSSVIISLTGQDVTKCRGEEGIANCTISNSGTSDAIITSLELSPALGYVYFKNPTDANGFTLASKATKTISLGFFPSQASNDKVSLLAHYIKSGVNVTDSVSMTFIGQYFTRNSASTFAITPDANNNKMPTPGKDQIQFSINLDNGTDISSAGVDSLIVEVNYNGGIVQYVPGSATIGTIIPGWKVDNVTVDDIAGVVRFILKSGGTSLNGIGELLKLTFNTFLPTSKDTTDKTHFNVSIFANTCLGVQSSATDIILDRTCAYDLRSYLVISSSQYALNAVNPNPVGSGGADLGFTVALNGSTEITMYNNMGEKVKTLLSGYTQAGNYSIKLPVEDLNSGMYIIRMTSNNFHDEKQVVITK